jgi:deoxyhypusine synthase
MGMKSDRDNEQLARKNLLRKSKEIKGRAIVKGYDFNQGVDYEKIIKSYKTSGFQATHLSRAIGITREMIRDKAFIFLGYTSNMMSSGLREIFRYLVEHKKINVIVTTTGGIEEDVIKCLGDFYIGDFRLDGRELRKKGINRIGNVLVPNNRYVAFENFVQGILQELYDEQKRSGRVTRASDIIYRMGERIGNRDSVYYWAWRNKIKVYCPVISDGALGDNIYFFKLRHEDFVIDVSEDLEEFNNTTIGLKKSGVIILGSGVVKHAILNANMLRNGADYAVYINTSQEFDGSDAGAMPGN